MIAMDSFRKDEEKSRLSWVAELQTDLINRYKNYLVPVRVQEDFERDITRLVHAIYRESQEPLIKQLTDFVMLYSRPIVLEANNK